MMQMVNNNPRTGYEQLNTNEETAEESENALSHSSFNWGSNSAVASLSKAMKDLARDPFGMGANSPTAAPMSSNNPPLPTINRMHPNQNQNPPMNMYQMRNFNSNVNPNAYMSPRESV